MDAGVRERFQPQCERLQRESVAVLSNVKSTEKSEEARIKEDLKEDVPLLTRAFHGALVDAIIQKFP